MDNDDFNDDFGMMEYIGSGSSANQPSRQPQEQGGLVHGPIGNATSEEKVAAAAEGIGAGIGTGTACTASGEPNAVTDSAALGSDSKLSDSTQLKALQMLDEKITVDLAPGLSATTKAGGGEGGGGSATADSPHAYSASQQQ